MAEQPSEHLPLLKSNDEGESDPEQPLNISHNEDLNSDSVAEPQNTEITPAILEEGTILTLVVRLCIQQVIIICDLVENITDTIPASVLYAIPDESPPPYTPPTKMYNFPTEPPGYVTPPEGWKIEGLPTYHEEGRVSLVSMNQNT